MENVQNVEEYFDLYRNLMNLFNFERQVFPRTLLNQLEPFYSSLNPTL